MLDGPCLAAASGGDPQSLVIRLHGYGSNGNDLMSLASFIQPFLPDTAFVAPNAPTRLPQMAEAYQWWPIQSVSAIESAMGAAAAAPDIDAFSTHELTRVGLTDDRLVILGFSQGSIMALHVGMRRARPAAGIIGVSGMLIAPERLKADIRSPPPVYLVHGTDDGVVPFEARALTETRLRGAGVDVATHVSKDSGHTINQDGLEAAANFARMVLGDKQRP